MDSKNGYFVITRALLDSELWNGEPFTRGQAWIDLIGRANYRETERFIGARLVKIPRGSLFTTIEALAKRWRWSRHKTADFIKELEKAEMLSVERTQKGTALTIENYGKYQLGGTLKGIPEGHSRDIDGTLTGQSTILEELKNIKKGENARERATPDGDIEELPDGTQVYYPPGWGGKKC